MSKKRTISKQLLRLILVFAMLLTTLPLSVFAVPNDDVTAYKYEFGVGKQGFWISSFDGKYRLEHFVSWRFAQWPERPLYFERV